MKTLTRFLAYSAALATAFALVAIPATANASPLPKNYVTQSDITTSRAAAGTTAWFADINHLGAYATNSNAYDGSESLALSTPNSNDQVRVLNSYGSGVTAPTISQIISDGSFTYSGANVDFQIELFFTPNDPQYGPTGTSPCTAAGASYPGMCYTVIKWEPLVTTTSWTTVNLSTDTALASGIGGWKNTNRIGQYAKPGPLIGNTMAEYEAEMSNSQVLAVGVALGSGTPGATGYVQKLTYNGTQYNFQTAPVVTAPAAATEVNVTTTNNTNLTVTWTTPINDGGSPITGYVIKIYNDSNTLVFTQNAAGDATSTVINGADFSAELGKTYHATVTATNTAGSSDATVSDSSSTSTIADSPEAPDGTTLVDANTGSVVINVVANKDLVATIPSTIAAPGDIVYGFAYSTPLTLGPAVIAANGTATWNNVGTNLEAGNHRLSVTTAYGSVLGWAPFVLTAAATTGTNTGTAATGATKLATTGSDPTLPIFIAALLFISGIILRRSKFSHVAVAKHRI